jgi:hypothetical protein
MVPPLRFSMQSTGLSRAPGTGVMQLSFPGILLSMLKVLLALPVVPVLVQS